MGFSVMADCLLKLIVLGHGLHLLVKNTERTMKQIEEYKSSAKSLMIFKSIIFHLYLLYHFLEYRRLAIRNHELIMSYMGESEATISAFTQISEFSYQRMEYQNNIDNIIGLSEDIVRRLNFGLGYLVIVHYLLPLGALYLFNVYIKLE
mmetsp:Transcript_7890/g.13226  ORF Transcript_7890/g.13226 Transcript_7890/m.13226 type:complete len:149 (+) Transcript_7890:308-754(+)|eukprot:CAMPEP_0168610968 /NCGR_PEP_ID=MMETSP0449_2-20121227/2088_1 /TAXON_ID=1082188 /ORGANISM="Strombidium rassoulzadegani, Strain ras09" /LENGTH=148 /DNA_ID=CAMNT_0008651345 /DNA_START=271 /DNA_END=717 /DNA_ORIENTATION=-